MRKSIVISEQDSIAALLENDRVVEFFVNRGELLLGDIYTATVENILPGIDAAFVNLGKDKMGFLHANDVPGQGPLKERLVPKQKLLVQITKEPTGHKGPRVSTAISLPGRFLVLVPEERGVSISRRISEARERARLKAVVNLLKPPGVGLIIRTEAKGQGEPELFEDFEQLWDRWQTVVSDGEASIGPALIYRDQDLLYRVIRDAYSVDINEILVDSVDGQKRATEFLSGWAGKQTQVNVYAGEQPLLIGKGIDREIEAALSERAELPSGGHLNIQPTEALTVIDVNSGRFTSSRTQAETVRRTNLEAAQEISRQLRLRNVGGMVIVDFIDMESRKDQQQVLEAFQRALEDDRAKPQIGQLSDLGLVELTRRRQGQSLRELFTHHCQTCNGLGVTPTLELGEGIHRRLISTKPKEEESRGRSRRGGGRQQYGALRAATVTGGRVQSTIVEDQAAHDFEEALEEVPSEILEQMPDDILDQRGGSPSFGSKHADDLVGDVDDEGDAHSNVSAKSFQPDDMSHFEDDEDKHHQTDINHVIDEAELVRQELMREPSLSGYPQDKAGQQTRAFDNEEKAAFRSMDPEPEPLSGVFKLKTKAQASEDDGSDESFQCQDKQDEEDNLIQTGKANGQFVPSGPIAWWGESASQQLELPLQESKPDKETQNEFEGKSIQASSNHLYGDNNFEHKDEE